MAYLPTSTLISHKFQALIVYNSTLVSLYDKEPSDQNSVVFMLFANIKLIRGMQWNFFQNLKKLKTLIIYGMDIVRLGEDFQSYVGPWIIDLTFEKTKVAKLANGVFSNLKWLKKLDLRHNQIKILKRSMFAKPALTHNLNFEAECPPKELIRPCDCDFPTSPIIFCANITSPETLIDIVQKTGSMIFKKFILAESSLIYLPTSALISQKFQALMVSDSTLVSLFDKEPSAENSLVFVFLARIQITHGIQWNLFKNLNKLEELLVYQTEIKTLGNDFQQYVQPSITDLYMVETKMVKLANGVFSNLKSLTTLHLRNNKIKILKRSMFAKPTAIRALNCEAECPPKELISPCDCDFPTSPIILCANITSPETLIDIVQKTGSMIFKKIILAESSLIYLPTSALISQKFQALMVSDSTLVSLFDKEPSAENSLVFIFLAHIQITQGIQWNLFKNFNKLEELLFLETEIKTLGNDFQQYVQPSITDLYMVETKMEKLANGVFSNLKSLTTLHLRNNKIKILKRSMFAKPAAIRALNCEGITVACLGDSLRNIQSHYSKIMSLKTFDASLFAFIVILCLNLALGDECPPPKLILPCACVNPKTPAIICINITKPEILINIVEKTGGMKFRKFILFDSSMMYLPTSALISEKFQALMVSKSTLISLFDKPPPIENSLKFMFLAHIQIERGMQWQFFQNLNKLEELLIYHINIEALGRDFQRNVKPSVTIFHLVDTKTVRLANGVFENLKSLTSLHVRNSKLKILKRSMFAKPAAVETLNFESNQIEFLPDDMFSDMPSLREIVLTNNKISMMKEAVFGQVLKNLDDLVLDGNPINCNCELSWIGKEDKHSIRGVCTEPDFRKGKPIKELTDKDFAYC
ncbi:uncharacterized protein TNCT_585171 [Trichonephila clavata]|uniref:Uncharacterized protein n=1 Tax=Trichonephila clavata TaxID=2740835 RepID=A0A8X6L204_TRICU|nr:uncharacterized protein TNCT_585171 [Trichonephila clavata]